uniref:FunJ2 n=1 Tax=Streptosporangium sp. KD35 TaxID=2162663 RepID=A0A2U9KCZ3_9ACTN|nr:FunJ2 [Streptosporangium sp. KD35]
MGQRLADGPISAWTCPGSALKGFCAEELQLQRLRGEGETGDPARQGERTLHREVDVRVVDVDVVFGVQPGLAHLLDEAVRVAARPRVREHRVEPDDRLAVDEVGEGVRGVLVAAHRHDLGSPRNPAADLGVAGDLPSPRFDDHGPVIDLRGADVTGRVIPQALHRALFQLVERHLLQSALVHAEPAEDFLRREPSDEGHAVDLTQGVAVGEPAEPFGTLCHRRSFDHVSSMIAAVADKRGSEIRIGEGTPGAIPITGMSPERSTG